MTLSRIPKWTFWVFGAVALWSGWVFGVRTPIISRLASLDELHSSARNKITAQSERVTAIPAMLQRLDSTQQLLDSMLTGCVETDTLLELSQASQQHLLEEGKAVDCSHCDASDGLGECAVGTHHLSTELGYF